MKVCPHGHPRTPENTYLGRCRVCRRAATLRYFRKETSTPEGRAKWAAAQRMRRILNPAWAAKVREQELAYHQRNREARLAKMRKRLADARAALPHVRSASAAAAILSQMRRSA